MSFWKKNYKSIIFCFSVLILLVVFLLVLFLQKKPTCIFITVENDYYVVNSTEENSINVPLYISNNNDDFVNKEFITRISIIDSNSEVQVPLDIETISYLKEVNYNKKVYYEYDLALNVNIVSYEPIIINEAYLEILYNSGYELKMKIGSLCIYNYEVNNEMYYTTLKGIIREYQGNKMLIGVLIKLSCNDSVRIYDIMSLNSNVMVDMSMSEVVSYDESNDVIDRFIDENYKVISDVGKNCIIEIEGEQYLLLCLKYKSYLEINDLGFIIKYQNGDNYYEKVINPFKYFKNNNAERSINKYIYE